MLKKRTRIFALGLAIALLLFEITPAQAAVPEATAHYDKGIVQYNLGHFPEAISEFEKAYELDASPILLFNLAQAYRQEGNTERAIFFYRRYLTLAPTAKNREDVEKRLKELEELRQRQDDIKGKPPTGIEAAGSPSSANEPGGAHSETLRPGGTPGAPPPTSATAGARPDQTATTDSNDGGGASDSAVIFASAGPAVPRFSGRDLASPVIFSGELGARLVLLPGVDRLEAGLAGVFAQLSYSRADGSKGSSSFPGVFADARLSHALGSRVRLGVDLGLGVIWWTGLESKNPFTVGGIKASGAVAMPSLRLGPALTVKLTQGLYAGLAPRFVLSKTTSAGLSDATSSVLRLDVPLELGYVF